MKRLLSFSLTLLCLLVSADETRRPTSDELFAEFSEAPMEIRLKKLGRSLGALGQKRVLLKARVNHVTEEPKLTQLKKNMPKLI